MAQTVEGSVTLTPVTQKLVEDGKRNSKRSFDFQFPHNFITDDFSSSLNGGSRFNNPHPWIS